MKTLQTIFATSLLLAVSACGNDDTDGTADAKPGGIIDAGGRADARGADAMEAQGCGPSNTICTGETICVNDACEQAFGRTYKLQVLSTLIETTDSEGMPWDISGGAPDPYVVVEINGTEVLRTDTVQDSFAPTFPKSTLQVIPAGATITATVYDADVDADDVVYICEANPITVEHLRQQALFCGAGEISDVPSLLLGIGLN